MKDHSFQMFDSNESMIQNIDGVNTKVEFSPESLIDYLVTQSNIINAVEGGNDRIDEVRVWLREAVAPLFPLQGAARFRFHGPIRYPRRME